MLQHVRLQTRFFEGASEVFQASQNTLTLVNK